MPPIASLPPAASKTSGAAAASQAPSGADSTFGALLTLIASAQVADVTAGEPSAQKGAPGRKAEERDKEKDKQEQSAAPLAAALPVLVEHRPLTWALPVAIAPSQPGEKNEANETPHGEVPAAAIPATPDKAPAQIEPKTASRAPANEVFELRQAAPVAFALKLTSESAHVAAIGEAPSVREQHATVLPPDPPAVLLAAKPVIDGSEVRVTPPPSRDVPALSQAHTATTALPDRAAAANATQDHGASSKQDTNPRDQEKRQGTEPASPASSRSTPFHAEPAEAATKPVQQVTASQPLAYTPVSSTVPSNTPGVDMKGETPAQPANTPAAHHLPETNPASAPQPTREISVRIPSHEAPAVDVKFVERNGSVHVSVRTADTELARNMQSNLGDLVRNLDASGYGVEPLVHTHVSEPSATGHNAADHHDQHSPGGGSGGDARQQFQNDGRRNRARWMNVFSPLTSEGRDQA